MTEEHRNLQEQVKKLMQDNTALQARCQKHEEDHTLKPSLGPLHQSEGVSPLASSPIRIDDLPREGLAMSGVLNLSGSSCSDISQLELSLEEAEGKIAGLLKVKEELATLAVASRSLTACTVIPIIVLLVAIVTAFLPVVSNILGTRDF